MPGEAEPKENGLLSLSFSGVVFVVVPDVEEVPLKGLKDEEPLVPKNETGAGLSASLSLPASLSLVVSFGAVLAPKVEPPKSDGEEFDDEPKRDVDGADEPEPKREGAEVEGVTEDLPNEKAFELVEDGAPKEKADVGAVVLVFELEDEPNVKGDLDASEEVSDVAGFGGAKLNGLPSVEALLESTFGTKPPGGVVEEVVDARGLKPANPLGAAGIANDGADAGLDASGAVVVDELAEAFGVVFGFSSRPDFTEIRRALYRSKRSATSTNGSDSIAFETADRKEALRPRRAL